MRILLVLAIVMLAACGGDDGPAADASSDDAAQAATMCPPTDDLSCSTSTQICVVSGPFGPTNMSACEPVPAGCEKDRTCACVAAVVCNANDTCSDTADNTVFCDNGSQ